MPLTPPPDYSKLLISVVAGAAVASSIWLLTKNTLPVVGDREHALPHGGLYKDGTKTVLYSSPGKLNSLEGHSRGLRFQPWAVVIALVGVIVLLSRASLGRCQLCGCRH
uniref:Movement protein TGB2 n=1 Tax=Hop latent virus TaxID=104263 RepID=A0A0D3QUD0_9VIRU|nr:triple gene block protein 2 [Hop latent virus]WCR76292.1 triple gene block protein 2 [Hop latent virus]